MIAGCEHTNQSDSLIKTSDGRGYDEMRGDGYGGDQYEYYGENPFVSTDAEQVSTFSIDADGGSYANCRRFIESGEIPPEGAVRIEEFINYFIYDYPDPTDGHALHVEGEVCECPWDESHRLIRIGIKGKSIAASEMPPSNVVFLIDVSGSMSSEDKLPLLRKCFKLLADQFGPQDVVSIVTYSGASSVPLNAARGHEKQKIYDAINSLGAGGSTAGAQGIMTAYEIAEQNYIQGGNNRVILASDGDFNVGIRDTDKLIELIEEMRDKGIFLTTIGVGRGNLNDRMMEQVANHGNGTYEYIDDFEQGRLLFTSGFSKLYTVAQDVKVQVRFNPTMVKEWRLIGYENRVLNEEDFEDDTKDAGELGAGQTVTALYEIVPNTMAMHIVKPAFYLDFRYKEPLGESSIPISVAVDNSNKPFALASENTRFAAAVASYGMLLTDSQYKGETSLGDVLEWARSSSGYDPEGLRAGFIKVVSRTKLTE